MEIKRKINVFDMIMVKEKTATYIANRRCNTQHEAIGIARQVFRMGDSPYEKMVMLCLNNKNKINGAFEVSKGSASHTLLPVKEMLQRALLCNASAIIILHNHPSGDLTPSNADISATRQLIAACDTIGISFYDHIIISDTDYYSFKEAGN